MSEKRLKVGVIGCGGIAQMMHLPTLAERPDLFEIAALADVNRGTLEAVGERYHVSARFTDEAELCRMADLEAVLIFSSGSHHQAAIRALDAGKHLFVEKPVAFGLKEIDQVAQVAKRSKGLLMVGYHKRFDPAYRKAKEVVQGLKDLRYVEVTILHPDDGAYRTHHAILPYAHRQLPSEEISNRMTIQAATEGELGSQVEQMTGTSASLEHKVGAFMCVQSLIHDVNALRGILGEPDRVLFSQVWREGFAQSSVSEFGKGVRVNMSWISVPGVRHYEERLRFVSPECRVTLTFPSPYLRHFPTPLEIERMDGKECLVVESHTVSYEEAFRAELHHFRECILKGKRPELTIDDALGDARWIDAIVKSYGKGHAGIPVSQGR